MKLKLNAIAPAVFLGCLLGQASSVMGQSTDAPTPTVTVSDLKHDQRLFLEFIRDGENEYLIATNRLARQNNLWVNNLAKAKVLVKINLTLMDGNNSLQSEDARIAALKRIWLTQSTIDNYSRTYRELRTRTYLLEDNLQALMVQLTPQQRQIIQEMLAGIENGRNIDEVINSGQQAVKKVQGFEDQGVQIAPSQGGSYQGGSNQGGGDPDSLVSSALGGNTDALRQALINSGISPSEADRILRDIASGNARDLAEEVKAHPDNPYIAAALARVLANSQNPPSPDQISRYIKALQSGDPQQIGAITSEIAGTNPQNPFFKQGGDLNGANGGGYNGGGNGGGNNGGYNGGGNGGGGGGADVDGVWSPAEQMNGRKRAHYLDQAGGQIVSEKLYIYPSKSLSDEIDWAFSLKESSRNQTSDGGYKVTYELVNDGTPANAEFEVTAWDGPDGSMQSSEKSFTVTFPKPGDYTIKVHGKTGKYHNEFTIPLSVNF